MELVFKFKETIDGVTVEKYDIGDYTVIIISDTNDKTYCVFRKDRLLPYINYNKVDGFFIETSIKGNFSITDDAFYLSDNIKYAASVAEILTEKFLNKEQLND